VRRSMRSDSTSVIRRSTFERGAMTTALVPCASTNWSLAAVNRQLSDGVAGQATLDGAIIESTSAKGYAKANHLSAVALLKADHRKVEELFAEFEAATGAAKKQAAG
jgi:hypothetical protein